MILYIAFGGLVGTVARYLLQGWVQQRAGAALFPLGTLAVNLAGSLALGFVLRYATGSSLVSPELRAGAAIGFCGAFTTMSTFGYETTALLVAGDYRRAALYVAGSVLGCIVAVFAGAALANKLL
jgi:CrcB protein